MTRAECEQALNTARGISTTQQSPGAVSEQALDRGQVRSGMQQAPTSWAASEEALNIGQDMPLTQQTPRAAGRCEPDTRHDIPHARMPGTGNTHVPSTTCQVNNTQLESSSFVTQNPKQPAPDVQVN